MNILVTGGLGFIGNHFIRRLLKNSEWKTDKLVNLDKMTYAANPNSLEEFEQDRRYVLVKGDICDSYLVNHIFEQYRPDLIVHFAAETHVDNSIKDASAFIQTNIVGTFNLLKVSLDYWQKNQLPTNRANRANRANRDFRLINVSSDEIYGSLQTNREDSPPFTENSPYLPNSPYSASKAAADHLVRAYYKTYGLPTITTHSSNNYGPWQHFEKFIPKIITNIIRKNPIPIYGRGEQIRDWLYVADNVEAIELVCQKGKIGETYNIGGGCEMSNLELAKLICKIYDQIIPSSLFSDFHASSLNDDIHSASSLISFVPDRPGHDFRYAVSNNKIKKLGWKPTTNLEDGLKKTISWYNNC